MKILISTDTSCLVKEDTFKGKEINVFPLNVIVDGQEYLDTVSINQTQLKEMMNDNKVVKTSTPPLGEVISYFEDLFAKGYEKIIHFTISSKLSSMYQLFTTVAESYFPGKLFVIDSYGVSSVMLCQVFFAYDEMLKGTPVEEIVEKVAQYKGASHVVFIPEDLTTLKNGGRISPAIAIIGNTIGIKPVIVLKDGSLDKDGMTKNAKKTFHQKLEEFATLYPTEKYDYTLVNFGGKEGLLDFIKEVANEELNGYELIEGLLPINVCAHCGLGTIGIVISPTINGKSLKEFLI